MVISWSCWIRLVQVSTLLRRTWMVWQLQDPMQLVASINCQFASRLMASWSRRGLRRSHDSPSGSIGSQEHLVVDRLPRMKHPVPE